MQEKGIADADVRTGFEQLLSAAEKKDAASAPSSDGNASAEAPPTKTETVEAKQSADQKQWFESLK